VLQSILFVKHYLFTNKMLCHYHTRYVSFKSGITVIRTRTSACAAVH